MVYNKLVRDRIPEIIIDKGNKPTIEILDSELYKKNLDLKLVEELSEYLESDNVEELADLVEVVRAILKFKNISIQDFEQIRLNKADIKGSFDKRIFLKEVI